MRGVVIRGIRHLVRGGFQPVAGAQGEPLRDVDFAAHPDIVCNTEF